MSDFQFLQNPITKKWVILAPRRAKRPDVVRGVEPVCPFCVGKEANEPEMYRVGGVYPDSNWQVRVIPNKFPFAPIHELIIHSQDHHKSFGELEASQVELILKAYRDRFNTHKDKGQVYIFHNHAKGGGESLPHPHTQLVVIPQEVEMDIPPMNPDCLTGQEHPIVETDHFIITCPLTSQWPDEVWIAPKMHGRAFGEITDEEITDFADALNRVIHILDLRHGQEFPFNFYIYPGGNWYLRLVPREKNLGGFEVGTNVYVNTQDPRETIAFIQEHFREPNIEKIKSEHQAEYSRHV